MSVLLFGIAAGNIDMSVAQNQNEPTSAQGEPDDGLWVEVEPTNLLPSDITGIYYLIPYRNRREKWGHTAGIGYSSFTPFNMEPDVGAFGFDEVYGTAEMPLLELQYSFKRNLQLGSVGVEVAAGMYQNSSDSDLVESDLRLIPVRMGLNLSFDNLYFEPFVVPYGMIGAYTVFYEENHDTVSFGGNTQVAPYFGGGVAFQLNWVDREAARMSYLESGIENTFIYVDARKYMKSGVASDPDLSTGFDWGAGMRLEF
jgi:hypothetical protein